MGLSTRGARSLVSLLAASAVLQGVLFSVLAPLLPELEDEFQLSKARIGMLVGAFAIGQGVAAIPVALMSRRLGVRRLALIGLSLLATTTFFFGLAGTFTQLLVARLAQGVSAGLCFSAGFAWLVLRTAEQRRARSIGVLSGAAAAGHMLGPVVGALAVRVGRFETSLVVAAVALSLAGAATRLPRPHEGTRDSPASLRHAHRSHRILGGLWLLALPAMMVGAIFALAPLQLALLGFGPDGIAATFLIAAAVGVVARPLVGAWADRRGMLFGIRRLLLLSAPLAAITPWVGSAPALSLLVLCAVAAYGVVFGPAMAFTSSAYGEAGVAQVVAFSLMAVVVGCSLFVGAAGGGGIAAMAGDKAVYGLGAALTIGTILGMSTRPSATVTSRP
jgi:predicted MFS family arabinose efflux permease